jgi:hypothetical protein
MERSAASQYHVSDVICTLGGAKLLSIPGRTHEPGSRDLEEDSRKDNRIVVKPEATLGISLDNSRLRALILTLVPPFLPIRVHAVGRELQRNERLAVRI